MKRKSLISLTAFLVCASVLTACTETNKKVSFTEYWYKDSGVTTASAETLEYAVSFKKGNGITDGYSADYTSGVYTTSLSVTDDGNYLYETSLSIDVTFTYGRAQTETFTDTVKTSAVFKKDKKLTPISSKREIVGHSPTNAPTALASCYSVVNYTVETKYAGGGGKTTIINNETKTKITPSFTYENDDYTKLDNEQLLLALRGISQSATTSSFYVYAPFTGVPQLVDAAFQAKKKGTEFSYTKDGAAFSGVIDYYPVTLSINDKNSGAAQTLWIAETNNPMSNDHRNVILRMEVPVSYSLGTLVYELKTANFSK